MDWQMIFRIGGTVIGICILIAIAIGILFAAYYASKKNVFFTQLGDGECKFVSCLGKVNSALVNYQGNMIRLPRNYEGTIDDAIGNDSYNLWAVGGVVWVGIFPFWKIHRFKMNWGERKQGKSGAGLEWIEESHDEFVDHIKVNRVPFPFRVVEAETSDGPAVNVVGDIETQVENPWKALFGTKNWLQTLTIKLLDSLKEVVKERTLREAVRKKFDSRFLLSKIVPLTTELEDDYGVKTLSIAIENVQPASQKDADALASEFETDQEAKNIEKLGEAEAKRLAKITEAQRAEGNALKEAYGDQAALVKALAGKDNLTTIALGVGFIPTAPSGESAPPKNPKKKGKRGS